MHCPWTFIFDLQCLKIGIIKCFDMKIRIVFCLCLFTHLAYGQYNIKDFGAKRDLPSTKAIQDAIDAATVAGGGRVVIPAGKYIIGTIQLKSNVQLHLLPGAVLSGSSDLEAYTNTFRNHGMIWCEDAINVSITGEGVIDARGTVFYDSTQNHTYPEFNKQRTRQKEDYMPEGVFYTDGPIKRLPKPGMTVAFYHCSQVTLKDFTLKDTPSWAIRLAYCDDALITGISIKNNLMVPNSDGVHCTTSRNVRMSNCDIRAGDDAFIVTGFTLDEQTPGYSMDAQMSREYGNKTAFAENIVVTNCQFQSRSSGIRIGYGQHPIRRCVFSNIVIYESNRGIGIFAHDASNIEDLLFSNIIIQTRLHNGQWWGNGEPIHLSSISRFEDQPVGIIKNVKFRDILATSEQGILVFGHPDSPMENISFQNIDLQIIAGKETMTYGGNIDLRPAADIDLQMFEHDIPAFYTTHVNKLDLNGIKIKWGENLPSFFTYALESKFVKDLRIEDFTGISNPTSGIHPAYKLTETNIIK